MEATANVSSTNQRLVPGLRLARGVSSGEDTTSERRSVVFGHKDLEAGEAVIVEPHEKHRGNNGQHIFFEWVADVTPASGAPFRTVLQEPNIEVDFRHPLAGTQVSVLIDRKKGITHFDKSDPRISIKAERAEQDRRFAEAAAGGVGTPASIPPGQVVRRQETTYVETQVVSSADAGPLLQAFFSGDAGAREQAISDLRAHQHPATEDVGDRLAALESLKAAGALSDSEYQAQRQHIVDSI
jgi:hypothetical protein